MRDASTPKPDPVRYADLDTRDRRRTTVHVIVHVTTTWVLLLSVYFMVPFTGVSGGGEILRFSIAAIALIAISAREVRAISRSRIPQSRAIMSLGTISALLIVTFSAIYLSLETVHPASFSQSLNHIDALYFTITTLATVGFGDIHAVDDPARVLVSVQMLVDLMVLGGMVRLLTKKTRNTLARADRDAPQDS